MIDVGNRNAWFAGSGGNGWIYDSITVDWKTKKNIKGREAVSVTWKKSKTKNSTSNGFAWKTSLGKALSGCNSGFSWVSCGSGVAKDFHSTHGVKSQPQISFSAL